MRRTQHVLLVLWVELRDEFTSLEDIPDIHEPFDHATVEAESEVDLVLCANLPSQRHRLAVCDVLDGDGANRADVRGRCGCFFTAGEGHGD